MKEKVWKRLFFSLLSLLIVGSIAFAIAVDIFDQHGIHWLGNKMHISIGTTCYFLEADYIRNIQEVSGEDFIGSTRFDLKGYLFDDFTGIMNLEQYPMPVDDDDSIFVSKDGRKKLTFSGYGVQFFEPWERYYEVHLLRADTDIVVIYVTQKDGKSVLAVSGESPEEAAENYKIYRQEWYDR